MSNTNEVTMGSLYELNQQAYDRVLPMSNVKKQECLLDLYEWTKEQRCDYTMLLCHERRDYTILHYGDREDETYKDAIVKDLQECLTNRGRILDIRYVQDQDAWEIWLRISENGGHQNYLYMFFNAEGFVVEV
jgi:hypothetical protein